MKSHSWYTPISNKVTKSVPILSGLYWDFIDLFVGCFFPNRRRKVLLVALNSYSSPALKIIAQILKDETNIDIYFTTSLLSRRWEESFDLRQISQYLNCKFTSPLVAMLSHWDLVLLPSETRLYTHTKRIPLVFVSHAITSWKDHDINNSEYCDRHMMRGNRLTYKAILARGPESKRYAETINANLSETVKVVGDCLVDDMIQRAGHSQEAKNKFPLDSKLPWVIIISTHGPNSLLGAHGMDFLSQLKTLTNKYQFLVALHPSNFNSNAYPDLALQLSQLKKEKHQGIHFKSNSDIDFCDYLLAADMAISDHSSMALYFIQLSKPIAGIQVENYSIPKNSPIDRLFKCIPVYESPNKLAAIIQEIESKTFNYNEISTIADDVVWPKGSARTEWKKAILDALNRGDA